MNIKFLFCHCAQSRPFGAVLSCALQKLRLFFAVLHRADETQPARNSCPRLPHSVDSRFGLHHVAVVLRFLRSPISLVEI